MKIQTNDFRAKELTERNMSFSSIVSTSTLPTRMSEAISRAVVEQMIDVKNLRQHCFVEKVEEGSSTYVYWKYDDLTGAYDRKQLEDYKYDAAGASQSTANFVEIAKGFQITWEADSLKRIALRVAQARAAVDKVKDREDLKIATALRASSALTSTTTASGVLSGTSADPIKDVANAVRQITDLGYAAPDLLMMENVNVEELASIIGSNEWYEITARAVEKGTVPIWMGLKVISLPAAKMTHGTAIVATSGKTVNLGLAHDTRLKIFDDNDSHTTKVQVYERAVPVIARADSGTKITGF